VLISNVTSVVYRQKHTPSYQIHRSIPNYTLYISFSILTYSIYVGLIAITLSFK